MFHKKTIRDIDLQHKTVLVRADYNVPLENGAITDDYRIEKSLPTIEYLLKQDCKVVICSHLGRPSGPNDTVYSLAPVARRLGELQKKHVRLAADCVGPESRQMISDLQAGEILLLQNLRFHKEEEQNDPEFARLLADGIDVFVQDGFGAVHRAHASTDAVTRHLPSVAGLLVADEVEAINDVMEKPERPLFALIGGAKIRDKIDMLRRFLDIADFVAVGGAMANTFLLAEGVEIGKSRAEPEDIPLAKEIMEKARRKAKEGNFVFYVPQDGVVAENIDSKGRTRIVDWGTQSIAEIENYPQQPPKESSMVQKNESILDIGPFSGAFIAGGMQLSNTVIWNGAMGVTETPGLLSKTGPYSQGTHLVVEDSGRRRRHSRLHREPEADERFPSCFNRRRCQHGTHER
jgi:phosphoglycerate kinase